MFLIRLFDVLLWVCVRAFPIPPRPGPLISLLLFMISLQHPPLKRGNSHRWVFVIFRLGHSSVLVDCLFSSHTLHLLLLLLSAVFFFASHRFDAWQLLLQSHCVQLEICSFGSVEESEVVLNAALMVPRCKRP